MPSKIEWTDESWNPIRARNKETGGVGHFCVKVSAGCQGCYAEAMQKRLFNNPVRYAAQDRDRVEIFLDEKALLKPLAWKQPRVVFPCSMTDLFGEWVSDAELDRVFAVMALTPRHTYKILTKRPERMREFVTHWPDGAARFHHVAYAADRLLRGPNPGSYSFNDDIGKRAGAAVSLWPLPNVQLGVSVEDQESAAARIPELLATPAAARIVSYEPALGPVDFDCVPRPSSWPVPTDDPADGIDPLRYVGCHLDQIIAGGESGPGAAPAHPDWFRRTRDDCVDAGVAFFFKQWGEWAPVPVEDNMPGRPQMVRAGDVMIDREGNQEVIGKDLTSTWESFATPMRRVGKKAAGRLLDGREWNEQPQPFATGGVVKAGPYLAGERGGEFQP